MKTLKCLLVDDEPLARAHLKRMLEAEPHVEVLGEAGTMKQALELVQSLKPSLLFLDIRMMGGGGFEILGALPDPPAAVFVTAHDKYAIRAFEVNAVDYLLKPVDAVRLKATLERARHRGTVEGAPLSESDMALLPLGGSGQFVAVRDILYIKAEGHYSRVVLSNGNSQLVRQAFHTWQERLPEPMFVRLDRGMIVNSSRITSCSHTTRFCELTFEGLAAPVEIGTAAAKRMRGLLAARSGSSRPGGDS
jgi:two-component system LytT family response regulator